MGDFQRKSKMHCAREREDGGGGGDSRKAEGVQSVKLRASPNPNAYSGNLGEAILLESTLLSLDPPSKRVLTTFRNVFRNADTKGDSFPTLGGKSAAILDDKEDLKRQAEEDRLTAFLRYYFSVFLVVSYRKSMIISIERSTRPLIEK
jgi:hypothetical protein